MRLSITVEAQAAMMELLKRAKSKKVEYGLELLLSGHQVMPGEWRWGGPEKMYVQYSPNSIGWFHTHPLRYPLMESTYRIMGWEPPKPEPPELGPIDILHILVSDHKLIGVGVPDYSERLVKFGIQKKEVPESTKKDLLKTMPMVAALGPVVLGIEEYYEIQEWNLGQVPIVLDVV